MTEHIFTLVVEGDLEDDHVLDALFEAGCDDATFGTVDGSGYADFIREAPTFEQAVHSAIRDVESAPNLAVLRVEPDDLVTMLEIAQRLGRSRESVRLLIQGKRGPGGFPAPWSHLKARSRLWRWADVAQWARDAGQSVDPQPGLFVAAINAALILRRSLGRLGSTEHEMVAELLPAT